MKKYILLIAFLLTQPVYAQLKDGQQFKDWTARCSTAANQQKCFLVQNIVVGKENKHRLLAVQIGRFQQHSIANFVLPLGVLLKQGVGIEVDGFKFSSRVPYTYCDSTGCSASVELDKKMISLLKKGKILTASAVKPDGEEVGIPVSLSGFTPAFESLMEN